MGQRVFGVFLSIFITTLFSIANAAVPRSPYCPDNNFWRITLPGDSLEHVVETDNSQKLNFENIRLLVWNVYKGGKVGVYTDLDILTQNADLALLQEGHLSQTFVNLACTRNDMNWKMARNFIDDNGIYAGVMIASRANPDETLYLKSPNTEPFSDVHKMTLVNYYNIPNRTDKLMVLSIHGINFVPYEYFVNQIKVVAAKIREHNGPVIFGGDFNTYTMARTQYLLKEMEKVGLTHAKVSGNEYNGLLILDHMFYRGLEVTKTEVLKNITTSDHTPLYFELKLK